MRTALALLLWSLIFSCPGADLAQTIRGIIDASSEARQCFWGIRVLDAESGDVLFAQNDDKFFIPASNAKLFTTSLALRRFGPDHRFRTRVAADITPDAKGRVREIRLIGGGDPNLSGRNLPYNVSEEIGPDALKPLRELADKVVEAGVRVVDGDVVGDDTAYLWEPFSPGWGIDDPTFEYGAPVSALAVNDNTLTITVFPGAEPGASASIALSPAVEYLTVQNRVVTVGPEGKQRVTVERLAGSRELIVSGTLIAGNKAYENSIAVDDPALFAACAFRSLLEARGVQITGQTRAVHRVEGEEIPQWTGVDIAQHESAPLSQILQVINKVSQNLHTEMMLREIARDRTGVGSRRVGLREVAAWLTEVGAEPGQWNFEDASGLSRLTLVTPMTITKLLQAMSRTPQRATWIATLPIGGVDGTLEKRFDRQPAGPRIHAKTGSLSHVAALAGYADAQGGRTRIFSIMVNNYNAPAKTIRAVMDRVALALLRLTLSGFGQRVAIGDTQASLSS